MQTPERRPPMAAIFDSSIEDSIEQVLALAMLHACNVRREIRLASVSISRNNLGIAAFCDLIGRFYGANLPVGMFDKGETGSRLPPMLESVLARRTADGRPLYPRAVERFNHTADSVAVIRNALTAQQDQNATVILSGPPANLLGLLELPGGAPLVEKKVRALVIAAPFSPVPAFTELIARWPGAIVFAGAELNQALRYPGGGIEQDFTWAANHPVVDAYRAAGAMPYDAPAAALAAVLHAVSPEAPYFNLSGAGAPGTHRALAVDPRQTDNVLQAFREVLATRPLQPGRGARGPQP